MAASTLPIPRDGDRSRQAGYPRARGWLGSRASPRGEQLPLAGNSRCLRPDGTLTHRRHLRVQHGYPRSVLTARWPLPRPVAQASAHPFSGSHPSLSPHRGGTGLGSAGRAHDRRGLRCFFSGRLTLSTRALSFAAALMLLFNPLLFRYDVGFELSVLATLAILIASPLIERAIPLEKLWGQGGALVLYTLAIDLFTFPVLLMTFGQVSLLSPLTNLLVLPLIPLAMLLTLLLFPFLFVLSALAPFMAFPLWLVLAFQMRIAEFFAAIPWGLFVSPHLPLALFILWYVGVASLFTFLYRKERNYVLENLS